MRASRRLGAASLALAIALTTATAACTSEPKDPAEQRRARVQARIEDTFSRSQADCIMDVLDEPTIRALDETTPLPEGSEALRIYSNAVVACTA
jgi:hypothetical protein